MNSIDEDNLKAIKKSASDAEVVVFAAGTGRQNNKRVQKCQSAVLEVPSCIANDRKWKLTNLICQDNRTILLSNPLCNDTQNVKFISSMISALNH